LIAPERQARNTFLQTTPAHSHTLRHLACQEH
jgi:hypothetical protein